MRRLWAIVLALALAVPWMNAGPAVAQQQAVATLTILEGNVTVARARAGPALPARDGMDLLNGDRVTVAGDAVALVTFIDGSTTLLTPGTDSTVSRTGSGQQAKTSLKVTVGLIWARVVQLLDPQAEFSVEGQTATATVRGTQAAAAQAPDGTWVSWVTHGRIALSAVGQLLTQEAGQEVVILPGQSPLVRSFKPNESVLRVTTPSAVFPLLSTTGHAQNPIVTPALLSGYAAPGIVVSQVPGSVVNEGPTPRAIEIPAGNAVGRYVLVIEGERDGAFQIGVAAARIAHIGDPGVTVAERRLSGRVRTGERLVADVTLQHDQATQPATALITAMEISDLRPLVGPFPGRLILAPAEVAAVRSARGLPAALPRTGGPPPPLPNPWLLLGLLALGGGVALRRARQ